jgi:Tfp pilus assembly protein PilO
MRDLAGGHAMTGHHSTVRLAPMHVHAVGVAGLLALAGIGYALGYAPAARAQHRAQVQRQAIAKANDEANATAQHIDTARLEFETLRAQARGLPASTDLVGVLTDAVSVRGLVAHNVVADASVSIDGLTRTTVVLHASGAFSDFAGLVADVGDVHPGAAIDGFTILPDPMGRDSLVFQASLSVYAPQTAPSGGSTDEPEGQAPAGAPPAR